MSSTHRSFIDLIHPDKDWDGALERLKTYEGKEEAKKTNLIGRLPLHDVCMKKPPLEVVEALLVVYPEGAITAECLGRLPIHLACSQCSEAVVKVLLDANPDGAKIADNYGQLPIHHALIHKATAEVVNILLEANPDGANIANKYGHLPVHLALKNKATSEVVKVLLVANPDGANIVDNNGQLPIHLAIRHNAGADVEKALLEANPNGVNISNSHGELPIHLSLKNKATAEVVKALLEANPKTTKKEDNLGMLPLHHGLRKRATLDVVNALVEAYPEATRHLDEHGKLPIHHVKEDASPELVRILFEAYTGRVDVRGAQRLQNAIQTGSNSEVWRVLVEAYPLGAMIVDKKGRHPLHIVIDCGASATEVLSILEAYPNAATKFDKDGMSPLHYASRKLRGAEVIQGLLEVNLGGGIPNRGTNVANNDGLLPIHLAIRHDTAVEVAKLLLEENPEGIYHVDEEGNLPIHFVNRSTSSKLVQVLVEAYTEEASTNRKKCLQDTMQRNGIDIWGVLIERVSDDVLLQLVEAYPQLANKTNKEGRLPLHQYIDRERAAAELVWALKFGTADEVLLHLTNAVAKTDKEEKHQYSPNRFRGKEREKGVSWAVVQAVQAHAFFGSSAVGELLELAKAHPQLFPLHKSIGIKKNSHIPFRQDEVGDMDLEEDFHQAVVIYMKVHRTTPEVVQALIKANPTSITTPDKKGKLPIHVVHENTCNKVVDALLQVYREGIRHRLPPNYDGPKIDMYTSGFSNMSELQYLPLQQALRFGASFVVVQKLLKVYPNAGVFADESRRLPLHYAFLYGATGKVVKVVLKSYPDATKYVDNEDRLPLHYACREGAAPSAIRCVLEQYTEGAEMIDIDGMSPLNHACEAGSNPDILLELIKTYPHAATKTNNKKKLPLHHYVCKEEPVLEVVQSLLDAYPASIMTHDEEGKLPLHVVNENTSDGVVETLLHLYLNEMRERLPLRYVDAQIDPYTEYLNISKEQHLPLQQALKCGVGLKVVQNLLKTFPNGVFYADKLGRLPLHYAFLYSSTAGVVRAVLGSCPDATKKVDNEEKLPLHYACRGGVSPNIVRSILDVYPEGIRHIDKEGKLPIHHVNQDASPDLVRLLFEAYAGRVDVTRTQGLFDAIQTGSRVNVWRALIEGSTGGPHPFLHIVASRRKNSKVLNRIFDTFEAPNENSPVVDGDSDGVEDNTIFRCWSCRWDETTRTRVIKNDPMLLSLSFLEKSVDNEVAKNISDSLQCNTTVEWLKLSNNVVGDSGATALARSLRESSTLYSLDLRKNNICQAGAVNLANALRANNTLARLLLGNNNVGEAGGAEIALALHKNKTLLCLDLENNGVGDEAAASLAHTNCLTTLNLAGNNITDTGLVAVVSALQENSTLTALNLGNNNISNVSALSDALYENKTLVALNLEHNNVADAGVAEIANALQQNSIITALRLGDNKVGDEGAAQIAAALRVNSTLTSLDLVKNDISDAGALSLARFLRLNNTLRTLDLQENNVGHAGVASLSDAVRENGILDLYLTHGWGYRWDKKTRARLKRNDATITRLDLGCRSIDDEVARDIADALHSNTTVKSVFLKCNEIGDIGVAALTHATLPNSATLVTLDLEYNKIGNAGAAEIAVTLCQNRSLVELILGNNNIGNAGVAEIADALCENNTLRLLNLGANNVGDVSDLACALRQNKSLMDLNLQFNNISDAGAVSFASAMYENSTLENLNLQGNRIGDKGWRAFAESLRHNKTILSLQLNNSGGFFDSGGYYGEVAPGGYYGEVVKMNESQMQTREQVRDLLERNKQLGSDLTPFPANAVAECGSLPDMSSITMKFIATSSGSTIRTHALGSTHEGTDEHTPKSLISDKNVHTSDQPPPDEKKLPAIVHSGRESVQKRDELDETSTIERVREEDRSTVVCVNWSNKAIGDHGAKKLAEALHRNGNVKEMLLDSNNVGDEGVASLATVLCSNSFITKISLKRNDITDTGAATLAEAIYTNATLEELELSKNAVGIKGASALASSLQTNSSLKCLKLEKCCTGVKGAKEIAKALHHNQTLTKLYLRENNIQNDGAEAFVDALQFNEALVKVDLSLNGIESELLGRIEKLLQRNKEHVSKPWTPEERNRICFLFSDPLVWRDKDDVLHPITGKLQLLEERSMLSHCIKESQRDVKISFDVASYDQLQRIAVARSGCLHFSGHGLEGGTYLLFEDGYGGAHFLSREQLSGLLEHHPRCFKVVFVSACHSMPIGQAFIDAGAKHVVCCEQKSELNDDAAIAFTRAFYRSLVKGVSVSVAFQDGRGAVSSWRKPTEAEKFMLLPADHDHDVPVFSAHPKEYKETESLEHSPSIPAAPTHFTGREYDMYTVFNALLSGRLVTLVGPAGIGLSSLSISVCHYLNERLQTIPKIDFIVCVKRNRAASAFHESLLVPLLEQLVAQGNAQNTPGKEPSKDCIFDTLNGMDSLVVFDDVRGLEDTMCGFLHKLFDNVQNVTVLLAAGKGTGFESLHAKEEVVNILPWST